MDFKQISNKIKPIIAGAYAPLPHARGWWLALALLSAAAVADVPGAPYFEFSPFVQLLFILLVPAFKATLLLWIGGWLWRIRWLRWFAVVALATYAFLALANVGCWAFYGFGISRKLMGLLAQTNPREASEFLPDILSHIGKIFASPRTYAALAAFALAAWLFTHAPRTLLRILVASLSVAGAVLYVWFAASFTAGRSSLFVSLRTFKYIVDQHRSDRELQNLIDRKIPFPDAEKVRSSHAAEDVIVIIGESANRPNLSLYGFPLDDTPRMNAWRDSLFVFSDALASSQITISNLERILTFKPDDTEEGNWWKYPTLTDLFNNAGYRTYWLSNQERSGEWGNSAGVLASTASVSKYIGMDYTDDSMLYNTTYDEGLLPELSKALADSASCRLVMLHLLGSHTLYVQRYPESRDRFSGADVMRALHRQRPWLNADGARLLAEYSNSILYTDSIWSVAARMAADSPRPSLVIYFSDHGEKVCEGDNARGRTARHVQVPFVVYANAAYRRANPQIMEKLGRARNRAFSTAALVHILMTLTDTSYPLYDPVADPLSDSWRPRTRYVDEQPY